MDFKAVVDQCKSLIMAISHDVVEESNLNDLANLTTRNDVTVSRLITESVRRKLPLSRSWCLAEVVAAHVSGHPVIALAGESISDTSEVKGRLLKPPPARDQATVGRSWGPDRRLAISNFGLVEVLSELVRLEDAETTLESDRLRINADIEASMGFERFNSAAQATLLGASLDEAEAEIALALVCDDDDRPLRLSAQAVGIDRARLLGTFVGLGATSAVATLADEYGYDLEDRNMPALWVASGRGQLEVAKRLVDHYGVSVDRRAGNGMTPLAAAAAAGHDEVVDFLLARGAAVDARVRVDRTALINAAMRGHPRILSLLGHAGADPDLVDAEGYSALAHAILGRHTTAVRALISDCAANVNLQAGPANFSALHWAARHGLYDITDLLVANGAHVDAHAEDGTTPLVTAVLNGGTETALLLLHAGAQVDATNDSGFGVLAAAVTSGDPSVLRALAAKIPREAYADLKDQRFEGQWSALDLAILVSNPAMVTVLVEALDWDMRRPPREGLPAIFLAVMSTKDETAESLATLSAIIDCGADVTAQDAAGASPLFVCRSAEALAVLTANPTARAALSAIVDSRIDDGRAALHVAAASNLGDVIRVLVTDLGAYVDLPGPSGATPLTFAVRYDATMAAQALLELGADPLIYGPDGMTLRQVAETYASDEMVALVNRAIRRLA
jgi:ankyrin repeat protein